VCSAYFCLYKSVILIFIDAVAAIELGSALADLRIKDSGHEDVHANEQLSGDVLASARGHRIEVQTSPTREIALCDGALVSHHTGAIDRDVVCGLLTECLRDVSFVLFTLYLLHACYRVSNFHLFSN
jgi:hypothetical protein